MQAMSTLSPGTQLGSYEILALLGAGGMGEVYRARDGKLRREVAIKVLPGVFTSDADRVARFHREALAIAALNHPNIAAIYGLEEYSATTFLVLELVEGETLAERMARGRLPIEEVLGRHSPRSQTGEHPDHARRQSKGTRLRFGKGARQYGRQRKSFAVSDAEHRRDASGHDSPVVSTFTRGTGAESDSGYEFGRYTSRSRFFA